MKLPCACPGDDSFHFCMWSKISLKLRSWTWCWQSELIGLFSCQACVKNETGKRAVGVIVWFTYYRAYPAWNVHISSLISFGPTSLLFVRRSWQQSVPRDATAAAGVAADGSTYVGLKPMHCLLKCVALDGDVKKVLDYLVGMIYLLYILWINVISNKLHGKLVVRIYHSVTIEHVMGVLCKFPPEGVYIIW